MSHENFWYDKYRIPRKLSEIQEADVIDLDEERKKRRGKKQAKVIYLKQKNKS